MTFQTSVVTQYDICENGQLVDGNPKLLISQNIFCGDANIQFGTVVSRSAGNLLTKGGAGTSMGVAVRVNKEMEADDSTVQYNLNDPMSVLADGVIGVTIANTGNYLDDLYYDDVTGEIYAGTVPGAGFTQMPVGCKLMGDVAVAGTKQIIRICDMIV